MLPRSAPKRYFLKSPFLVQHEDIWKNKVEQEADEKHSPDNPLETGVFGNLLVQLWLKAFTNLHRNWQDVLFTTQPSCGELRKTGCPGGEVYYR